ncbi:MAG: sigma-70 family RNA polymerase sigma factor [Candidatus Acidiferrum sp.]
MDATTTAPKVLVLRGAAHVGRNSSRSPLQGSGNGLECLVDEALIERLKDGDKEALVQLFRRYAASLHAVGRRILRDSAEAEDLVQDVFLYIHRKSSLFDSSKGTGCSWIFQIAYTQAFIRKRKLKGLGLVSSSPQDGPVQPGLPCSLTPEYDSSVEGVFGRNGWRKVLEELTEDQQETLWLHFFEGYSFSEIAEKLGQSYANVRNHHYRGLEKLRRQLAANALNRR